MYVFFFWSQDKVIKQRVNSIRQLIIIDVCGYPMFWYPKTNMIWNERRLNSRESVAEKGRPQGSNLISLGSLRFGGDTNIANEDNSGIVKRLSDKWVTTGAHN